MPFVFVLHNHLPRKSFFCDVLGCPLFTQGRDVRRWCIHGSIGAGLGHCDVSVFSRYLRRIAETSSSPLSTVLPQPGGRSSVSRELDQGGLLKLVLTKMALLENDTDRRSLFLPDILPCPGPDRCEFHAALFGQSADRNEIPQQWFCPKCQREHATTISPPSTVPTGSSSSYLESLPIELLLQINGYLLERSSLLLPLVSRTLYVKLGSKGIQTLHSGRSELVTLLARDLPAYATCFRCEKLRPYHSNLAWPLLKRHREERGVSHSVYAVSEFLAIKMVDSYQSQRGDSICATVLNCAGTYRKPFAFQETAFIKKAGFSQDDVESGLAITYEACGRISVPACKLLTHITYRINLRSPWVSYTVAQRGAILRGFYLCPHTFASKVQHRDPGDPTYPSDSSIVHWESHQGPMPIVRWICYSCPTEFQSTAELDESSKQHSIVFEVWRESTRNCNDGFSEMTFCKTPNHNHWMKLDRVRVAFEAAAPM